MVILSHSDRVVYEPMILKVDFSICQKEIDNGNTLSGSQETMTRLNHQVLCNLRTRRKQLGAWQFWYKVNSVKQLQREVYIQVRVIIRGHMKIISNN